jgi:rhamnosyltransferase
MPGPRATVVVPVKQGAAHLPALLEALARQEIDGDLEVLGIDSGSTDGSVAILERHGARTLRIAPEAFDHGETRNAGAREARGSMVVFLSQDAVPAGADCVQRLVAALEADGRIAGAFARQVPRPGSDPLTRRDLAGWIVTRSEARTVFVEDVARFETLPPLERYALSAFDNVASAIRRDLLIAHPFAPARFGEDLEWGYRMLRGGYGLAYVPEAVVVHSHARSARALYRRNYLGHRLLGRLFGLRAVPDLLHLLRAAAGGMAGDVAMLTRAGAAPALLLAAPVQAAAALYGQYRGARDEVLGRPYPDWA